MVTTAFKVLVRVVVGVLVEDAVDEVVELPPPQMQHIVLDVKSASSY
jgi:hypothetical protein